MAGALGRQDGWSSAAFSTVGRARWQPSVRHPLQHYGVRETSRVDRLGRRPAPPWAGSGPARAVREPARVARRVPALRLEGLAARVAAQHAPGRRAGVGDRPSRGGGFSYLPQFLHSHQKLVKAWGLSGIGSHPYSAYWRP